MANVWRWLPDRGGFFDAALDLYSRDDIERGSRIEAWQVSSVLCTDDHSWIEDGKDAPKNGDDGDWECFEQSWAAWRNTTY